MKIGAVGLALVFAAAGCGSTGERELAVTHTELQPGTITLVVRNNSEESARVSQVILNDAFVDFRASSRTIAPDDVEAFVVLYPWIRGENYDIQLMTSNGRTVDSEIEEAA